LREDVIGLVQHHQPLRRAQHRDDVLLRVEHAGRVVRVGDEDERRLLGFHARDERVAVERVVLAQLVAQRLHPRERGIHAVHDEGRRREHHRRARARAGEGDDLDEIIRAVAEQDLHAGRHVHLLRQQLAQLAAGGVGIAVQLHAREVLRQLAPHRRGQRVGVLHRVELHHAVAVGDVIGLEREDLRPDQPWGQTPIFLAWGLTPIFQTPNLRRARVRLQPFALGEGCRDAAERRGAGARHADHARALLEVVDAERRGKARRARGRQDVIRPGAVIADRLGAPTSEEDGARVAQLRQQGVRVLHGELEVLGGDAVGDGAGFFQAPRLDECPAP
jgi:hypothetical protein